MCREVFQIRWRMLAAHENGVFGKRCFCPLLKAAGFDEKWRKRRFTFYPHKKGLRSSEPGNRRKWRNGGCPPDKTTVCQKHRFRHPDKTRERGMGLQCTSAHSEFLEMPPLYYLCGWHCCTQCSGLLSRADDCLVRSFLGGALPLCLLPLYLFTIYHIQIWTPHTCTPPPQHLLSDAQH